jgi:hypothetical protein
MFVGQMCMAPMNVCVEDGTLQQADSHASVHPAPMWAAAPDSSQGDPYPIWPLDRRRAAAFTAAQAPQMVMIGREEIRW